MMMLAAAVAAAMAQAPDKGCKRPSPKEINEFKMKYLAQEMELSEEQTQKFIELYSKMSRGGRVPPQEDAGDAAREETWQEGEKVGMIIIDRDDEANIQKNPKGCHDNGALFIVIYSFRDNGKD